MSGFRYSKVNFYYRDNDGKSDNWQMTVNYALPFDTGNHRVLFDGFMDWTSATSNAAASMNFISQLKYDIGGHWGWKNTFYVGTEYVYWINKFGVRGVDEHNSNLLLKYHF